MGTLANGYLKKADGGRLSNGGTDAVLAYQRMMNIKYSAGVKEDGLWGNETNTAFKTYEPEKYKQVTAQKRSVSTGITPIANTGRISDNTATPALPKIETPTISPLSNGRIPDNNFPAPTKTAAKTDSPFNPVIGNSEIPQENRYVEPARSTVRPVSKPISYAQVPVASSQPMKSNSTYVSPNKIKGLPTPEATEESLPSKIKNTITDGYEKLSNWYQRQQAKDDTNLKEQKSSINTIPNTTRPILTGDTIKDTDRRYHIPEVIDLNSTKFGVRNRGDLSPLTTEGAPITTFKPFTDAKQYFDNSKDAPNSTYIAIDKQGGIKVGNRKDFEGTDYKVTKTFSNKVIDFNKNADGSYVNVPSNPNASKHTLSPSIKVMGDNGKSIDGKLSLLLPKEANNSSSYGQVTGGRYILQTPDGKSKVVSGSLDDIAKEFYAMKGKHPYVNVVTLDNGAYSRGLRTYDKTLTSKDLRSYDNQNSEGGNFAYLKSTSATKSQAKFDDFRAEALNNLQKLYPDKKVDVRHQDSGVYNKEGGRDINSQGKILKAGNSQTPVSLHNFNAARDYTIYVDGKPVSANNKDLYKKVLWQAADKTGTYHLDDWDPSHISLAKEGKGTAFDEIKDKYPEVLAGSNSKRSIAYLRKHADDPNNRKYLDYIDNTTPLPMRTNVYKPVNQTTSLTKFEMGGSMKRTLADSYKKSRKMATGGTFWDQKKNTDAVAGGADFLAQGINAFDQPDEYGVRSGGGAAASGALSGGAAGLKAGAAFGPYGAAIGAAAGTLIGGVSSVVGNNKAKKLRGQSIQRGIDMGNTRNQQRSDAAIAANPELSTGRLSASYFAMGGVMKGRGFTPPRLKKPMPKIQPNLDLMPNISQSPGRQLSRMSVGGDMTEKDIPYWLGANGGKLTKLSSQDTKVEGASHANGGVKFPGQGVELEGGETINNDFVFSKKLGFAQQQEKIAKKLGKIEKMPDTPLTRSTATALQRQTETLKIAQEATKQKMGIPNELDQKAMGGPITEGGTPVKTPINPMDSLSTRYLRKPTSAPTYDPTILNKDGQFITTKDDGTTGPWGKPYNPLPNEVVPLPTDMTPKITPSNKMVGTDNTYTPSRDRQVGRDIPTIKSPTGRNRYTMGGKLKDHYKMAMGGFDPNDDPKLKRLPPNPIPGMSIPTSAFPTIPFSRNGSAMSTQQVLPTGKKPRVVTNNSPGGNGTVKTGSVTVKPPVGPRFPLPAGDLPEPGNIAELNTITNPATTAPILSTVGPQAPASSSSKKKSTLDKVGAALDTITPFMSNIANASRKLPLPPLPTMDDTLTPSTVDYSSSRAEAVRQNRGANKSAEQNLNSGAAVTASRAANLAGQTRAVGQINEAENNQNAGIRNQTNQVNASIKSSNNAKTDNYNRDLVERQLKQQQLSSENLSNVEEKIQGMARDKKLFDLEDQKVMLEALKDDTGASFRGARSIFAKHLTDESLNQLDTHFTKLEADNKTDRANNREASRMQLDYLKKRNDAQSKSTSDILGDVSTVTTAKEDNANRKKK